MKQTIEVTKKYEIETDGKYCNNNYLSKECPKLQDMGAICDLFGDLEIEDDTGNCIRCQQCLDATGGK